MTRPLNLAERAEATRQTIARFDRPFGWQTETTCIHLIRAQARAFHHRAPGLGRLRSPLGARAALRRHGFSDVYGALDSFLPRIAPAAMWVGDIAALPGEDDDGQPSMFPSLCIFDGIAMLIGWHGPGQNGLRALTRATADITAAWRL